MKIAIVGTRGIPARYGGFEACAEKLSIGLVKKGYKVYVFCRKYLYPERLKEYKGVNLIYLPSLKGKFTDTFSHTFLSIIFSLFKNPDIIFVFNSANSPLCILPKILRKKIVINVDGLEWKRKKWNWFGKIYYKFCEFFSCFISDEIITDSKIIQNYYKIKFGKQTTYIPYGADFFISKNKDVLEKYGLKEYQYFFNGSRIEPENNQDLIIKAFSLVKTEKNMVFVGKTYYRSKYFEKLKKIKDERIKFLGPIYSSDYDEIMATCYAYIHGNEVGGTNPALLKAMGSRRCILAIDVPFNREVLDDCGIYFKDVNDLKEKIEFLIKNQEIVKELEEKVKKRAEKLYRWENVIDDYERILLKWAKK
ncbi:MAG: DUF1972 domain-containing protein [Candidatus Omnitrophica bacterium]|nr:DUF1972 domain-containing protein [Candidatus Omnitrophota bacterium]